MKKIFLIGTVLFLTVSCQDKDQSASKTPKANADSTVTLKVQVLTDVDSLRSTLPDSAIVEQFIKFKVVEVTNGLYDADQVRVKWLMGKTPLKKWRNVKRWALENGKTYTLTLRPSYILNSDLKQVRTGYYEQLDGGC